MLIGFVEIKDFPNFKKVQANRGERYLTLFFSDDEVVTLASTEPKILCIGQVAKKNAHRSKRRQMTFAD